jgi:hypothetical protein
LDHGLYRILLFYWLARFYLLKKSAKGQLYFRLDCGMLEYSTHKPKSKEHLLFSGIFLSRFGGKDCGVCGHSNRNPNKQEVGVIFE